MATTNFMLALADSGIATALAASFRWYRGATAATVSGVTVAEDGSTGNYLVSNAPAGDGYALTWETPIGVSGAWPEVGARLSPLVDHLILPIRTTGETAVSINLELYKDGVDAGLPLTLVELGSPGDYKASGWPVTTAGRWQLVWETAGPIRYTVEWSVAAAATAIDWHAQDKAALRKHLSGISPSAGSGYIGAIEYGTIFRSKPVASTDPVNPTCWLEYELEQAGQPIATFDDQVTPWRPYVARLYMYAQAGAGGGHVDEIFNAVLRAMDANNGSDGLDYLLQLRETPSAPLPTAQQFQLSTAAVEARGVG